MISYIRGFLRFIVLLDMFKNFRSALLQNSQYDKNTSTKEIESPFFHKTLSGPFLHITHTLLGTAAGSGDLSGVDGYWRGMRVVYSFQSTGREPT